MPRAKAKHLVMQSIPTEGDSIEGEEMNATLNAGESKNFAVKAYDAKNRPVQIADTVIYSNDNAAAVDLFVESDNQHFKVAWADVGSSIIHARVLALEALLNVTCGPAPAVRLEIEEVA